MQSLSLHLTSTSWHRWNRRSSEQSLSLSNDWDHERGTVEYLVLMCHSGTVAISGCSVSGFCGCDQSFGSVIGEHVYNRLGLRTAGAGDGVISLPAGARINYSRFRRGAIPTEVNVVPAEFCLAVPNGTTFYVACCVLPYLMFLSIFLYRATSFAATPFSFQTDATHLPTRLSFATILYHFASSERPPKNPCSSGHSCVWKKVIFMRRSTSPTHD